MPRLVNRVEDHKYRWLRRYNPPADWDKQLELTQQSSEYYAHMVQKFGKAMADYYWNRRYAYERVRDNEYIAICKEISEKSEKFLKSRGIAINSYQ